MASCALRKSEGAAGEVHPAERHQQAAVKRHGSSPGAEVEEVLTRLALRPLAYEATREGCRDHGRGGGRP